ncbi:MAG: phospholipid carrier-dependent glycosyltransferase [Caldilineaceae bacterium]|nr:phospholipid carrier-dependent glycosyltransferase [Caldilineaceae bacterium]
MPIAFLGLMAWLDPFSFAADFDYDEGINLMKTLLLSEGYGLYTDVWNDQPPFLTVTLLRWFQLVGQSVESARVLIALFSALLLWSFYLALRDSTTLFAALLAVVLLVISEFYLRLSGAVMIGCRLLALAMLSVAILLLGKPWRWQVLLSAIVMACALQTKYFVVLFLPAIGIHFLWGSGRFQTLETKRRLIEAGIWFATVLVGFLVLAVAMNALNIGMLLGTHFGAQARGQASFAVENRRFLINFIKQQPVYVLLALIGVYWQWRRRQRSLLLPLTLFLAALVALIFHQPVWYHHIPLLTIPLVWLAAFGVDAWTRTFLDLADAARLPTIYRRAALLIATALIGCAAIYFYPSPLGKRLDEQSKIYRPLYIWEIVYQLRADGEQAPGFVFTDRPFYAFQAGLPVVPQLAVVSRKRMETGIITDEILLDSLRDSQTRYVILERFTHDYSQVIIDEIESRYELIMENEPGRYYRRIAP